MKLLSTKRIAVFLPFILLLQSTAALAKLSALPDFTSLIAANSAAVVNISTTQKTAQAQRGIPPGLEMPDIPEGSPFGELFRRFFDEEGQENGEEQPGPGAPQDFSSQSLGSGFIISNDGYVLSNYHVIKGADEIIVRLSDKRELVAKVIGTDKRSDLALLKVESNDLPVVKVGASTDLKVGEWVLAIGSPFGFDHSATAGIVSALGRNLPSENYVPFIQTDVAINPGNSGGPLFNLDGEVVGINSQIYSRTGGYMGVSFAIPIEAAIEVADQLRSTGRVSRGWLGVLIQDVTRDLAESFGMQQPRGALVARVLPDSPAQKAGVQVGDIITRYGGSDVGSSASLPYIVGRSKIGTSVPVDILRNGKNMTLNVKLGELPDEDALELAAGPANPPSATADNRLSVAVTELSATQREELEIKKNGVWVQKVEDGPGREAGLRAGDVIMSVNNAPVQNVTQFKRLIESLPSDKAVPMLVQRREGPLFLALKIPANTNGNATSKNDKG